ncbi:MAG: Ig-like domain-containing protein [Gemmatimonadaceae bacterium]|nr:Ig-like domain-containing protein [Gemmatimonadaceae bacterium]
MRRLLRSATAWRRLVCSAAALMLTASCKDLLIDGGARTGSGTPKALRLDAPSVSLTAGTTRRVTAQLLDGAGQSIAVPSDLTLSYQSSAPAVFTVSSTGEVTGVTPGQGVLRAAVGALQVGVPVTVTPAGTQRLERVAGDAQTGLFGATLSTLLRVRAVRADGAPLANVTITFTTPSGSATPASAPTDVNGEATTSWTLGNSAGAQTLLASAPNFGSVTFTATALVRPVATVTVTPATLAFTAIGQSAPLTAVARDLLGGVVNVAAFAWTSSNPSVAIVSPTGLVTAVGDGTATIAASTGTISGGAQVTVSLPVAQPRLAFQPESIVVTMPVLGAKVSAQTEVVDAGGAAPSTLGTISCSAITDIGGTAGWATLESCGGVVRITATAPDLTGQGRAYTQRSYVDVSGSLASNSPKRLILRLNATVADIPVIRVLPAGTRRWNHVPSVRDSGLYADTLSISNGGGGTLSGLSVAVTYAPGQPTGWISTVVLTRTETGYALAYRVNRGALPTGMYSATLRVTSTQAGVLPADVPILLDAGPFPTIGLSPDTLDVRTTTNGAAVQRAVDILEVNGLGDAALGAITCRAPRYTDESGWLTVVRCADSLVVRVDPGTNYAGTTTASVWVLAANARDSVRLSVQQTVTQGGGGGTPIAVLGLSQDSISVRNWSDGPSVRRAIDIRDVNGLSDAALGALTCRVRLGESNTPWVTVERCADSLVVNVSPANFNGTDRASVWVIAANAADSVRLRVQQTAFPADLLLEPSTLNLSATFGGAAVRGAVALGAQVPIGSPTTYPRSELNAARCTIVSVPAGAPALSVAKCGNDSVAVLATPDAAAGTYTYLIDIDAPTAKGPPGAVRLTVNVTVTSSGPSAVDAMQVSALYTLCAKRLSGNTLVCWGANSSGQLGNGTRTRAAYRSPVQVPAGTTFTMGPGQATHCAIASGTQTGFWCWGSNGFGQVGDGTFNDALVPTRVLLNAGSYQKIAAGNGAACAIADNTLYCWGLNSYGQATSTVTPWVNSPVAVSLSGVTDVAPGYNHTCALASGLYCWGIAWSVGNGGTSTAAVRTPTAIAFPDAVPTTGLVTGFDASCLRNAANSALYCWGPNGYGATGTGISGTVSRPTRVTFPTSGSISWVAMGENHACAIVGGDTYCWGSNSYGQLGDGTTNDRTTPVRLAFDPGFSQIWTQVHTTCGLVAATSRVMCWGYGLTGEIGNGLENNALTPTYVKEPP